MLHSYSVPECVSNTILKVDEVVFIDLHQVSAVKVQISFLENITNSLLLRLFFVLGVADKRSDVCDLRHQQTCFTLKKKSKYIFYWVGKGLCFQLSCVF